MHHEKGVRQELQRSLTLTDLVFIGLGSTVGSGAFVLTGYVRKIETKCLENNPNLKIAKVYAGPASIVSWLIAGLVCMMSAFSYLELSSKIPSQSGPYNYAFVAIGEMAASVTGFCLTLQVSFLFVTLMKSLAVWGILLCSCTQLGHKVVHVY